ncbi:MAG: hypothetical protein ACRD26_23645, partial [Vicinamibacterales bacterium]
DETREAKTCPRCGGPAVYQPEATVPGDPLAPRGSRRAAAHPQPAWACFVCGYLEPEERRTARIPQRQGA